MPPIGPGDHVRGFGREAIVYLDLACPRCAVSAQDLADDGNVRVAFRHLALKVKHERAVPLALALEFTWQYGLLAAAAVWLFAARRGVTSALVGAGALGVVIGVAGGPVG